MAAKKPAAHKAKTPPEEEPKAESLTPPGEGHTEDAKEPMPGDKEATVGAIPEAERAGAPEDKEDKAEALQQEAENRSERPVPPEEEPDTPDALREDERSVPPEEGNGEAFVSDADREAERVQRDGPGHTYDNDPVAPQESVPEKVAYEPSGNEPLLNSFVDVVDGPFKGRYGVYVRDAVVRPPSKPKTIVVKTRDDDDMEIEVSYGDVVKSEAGHR